MKQLSILDSAFINLEVGNTPQHVGGLGIYDPSTAPGGLVRFKQVISNFERRLQRLPLFRTRLVEVPGGIDRPYWVKDAHFDVEFHLRHIALPQPGDWRQLCIQVARLHARPLDMSRPLWEAYIIEGLDNIGNLPSGSFAIYTKMHHSLVDGAGGASFMSALHDLTPEAKDETLRHPETVLVDHIPSSSELLGRALINRIRDGAATARGSVNLARQTGKFALAVATGKTTMPKIESPRTRFNGPVGPHRVVDALDFSLDEFKEIKEAVKVKLNDCALTVIGGAMQRYLAAKDETPERSLAVSLPVNMRQHRATTDANNQVGSIFASLHSDIEDPLQRLQAVHASTLEAKRFGEISPMIDAFKVAGIFSPALTKPVARRWADGHWSRWAPLSTSTVITNVPGPDFDLYCAGAKLVRYHGMGVLTPGLGLFHTVFSHAGRINITVLADRECMPDPAFYMECVQACYDELLGQVRASRAGPGKSSERAVRGKRSVSRKTGGKTRSSNGKAAAARIDNSSAGNPGQQSREAPASEIH